MRTWGFQPDRPPVSDIFPFAVDVNADASNSNNKMEDDKG